MIFSKFESKLFVVLAESLGCDSDLQAYEYKKGIKAGYMQIGNGEDSIQLVFSFPKEKSDCYLTFTDGDPKELCKEMASLQEYNDETAHLCDGHTVPTSSKYMKSGGWVSYLITVTPIAHKALPMFVDIFGRNIRFHLAVPLNKEEYEIKLERGYDALLDFLDEKGRDIVDFNWNA